VALAISIGIKQAAAFTADGRIQKKILCYCRRYATLNLNTMITMQKNIDDRDDFKIAQDAAGANIIYSMTLDLE
jgi:hypothetical protein